VIVRVTAHVHDLRPGQQVEVDAKTKAVKRLLAAGVLVPVKKQT
jgi:cold shock CspA family protein